MDFAPSKKIPGRKPANAIDKIVHCKLIIAIYFEILNFIVFKGILYSKIDITKHQFEMKTSVNITCFSDSLSWSPGYKYDCSQLINVLFLLFLLGS